MERSVSLRQIVQTGAGLGSVCLGCLIAERGEAFDKPIALACAATGVAAIAHSAFGRVGGKKLTTTSFQSPLDRVLMHWDEENLFTLRDLLNSVAIFGRTGSGKTSSSGKALARAIIRVPGSGGLIIAAKPTEDRVMWQQIFREAGREQDLLIFSPEHPLRFNLLDYECRSGGGITRNITRCLMVVAENLKSGEQDSSGDSAFWRRESERMLFNCVEVVKLATGKVSAPDLHRFLSGAAMSAQQILSEEWLAGFHNQCLKSAWGKPKTAMQQHDFELAKEYFLGELPNMAEKTRSSIMVHVLGLLHIMNQGLVRELLSSATNVTPDDLFQGRWLFLDLPIADYGETGAFVNGAIKYMTQRAILRRVASETTPPVVIWGDEAHTLVTSQDAHFLAQCRSHHGAMVYLSQSIPGYVSAVGGEHAKSTVDALQASFSTKVIHALGDLETATWASGLVGRSLQTFIGGSSTRAEGGAYEQLTGPSQYSSNYSQSFENTLQASAFLHGLRTGGPSAGYQCDAIILRTGDPFANGQNWLKTSFSQKDSS